MTNNLDYEWRLTDGKPNDIGDAINPGFLNWVRTELRYTLPPPGNTNVPCFTASDDTPTELYWLSDYVNNSLQKSFLTHVGEQRAHLNYFIGVERSYNCSESNCVYHNEWHFHFMEVLDTDTETVQSSVDRLEIHFEKWIDQLVSTRFPSITFSYSSLIGERSPYISTSRYF